jgi:hypothetical protein
LLDLLVNKNCSLTAFNKEYQKITDPQKEMDLLAIALRKLHVKLQNDQIHEYAYMRPDLNHTLGSWMLKSINNAYGKKGIEMVINDPYCLFTLYNTSLKPEKAQFTVKDSLAIKIKSLGKLNI